MKTKSMIFVLLLVFGTTLSAQSLFEEATSSKDQDKPYELNGYLRGTLFVGKVPDINEGEIKSGYGEASLKLKLRYSHFGDAFAEIRFRRGNEFNESVSELNLREAYVNTYIGPFDFRIGHQIVVWGRADGINPTDVITPKNMLIRSPDKDDRREGNFLLRFFLNMQPFRLEAIWVPVFSPSVVPTSLLPFPPNIALGEPNCPDTRLNNSAFAFKLNLELPSFDGSLSYFNGHNPFPGISSDLTDFSYNYHTLTIFLKSYRLHLIGADFSTTLAGSFGLRGEVAYRRPHKDNKFNIYIPNSDLQYVIGLDKEFSGNFSVILQYIGRYVFNFRDLAPPADLSGFLEYELERKNRMITSQQYELSHSLSCRAEKKMFHETLRLEVLGMANLTSEEFLLRPKVTYDIADSLTFSFGGELYSGPDDTLFGSLDSALSSVFFELKAFF